MSTIKFESARRHFLKWPLRELNQKTTVMATKTSLKKWRRAASNFIALIRHLVIKMRQMLAIFSAVEF